MDINGNIEVASQAVEFTIELDTDRVWTEIEDSVRDVAYESSREAIENADFGVDYAEGARSLLNDYNPGSGCSLARDFEEAVQGAVGANGFLAEAIKEAVNETATGGVDDIGRIRAIVREEIRLAVTAVASQMTSVV
jgi:hypothetical protein